MISVGSNSILTTGDAKKKISIWLSAYLTQKSFQMLIKPVRELSRRGEAIKNGRTEI
jgi:hypothetical protein